ncbi:hypothetical protein ACHAQH_002950 [Verticillium albo-atrum]
MKEELGNRKQQSAPKRCLTPNRALFDSYGEAHRTIAGYPISPYQTYDEELELPSLSCDAVAPQTPMSLEEKSQPQTAPFGARVTLGKMERHQTTKMKASRSHYDNIKKRSTGQSGFDITHLSGRGGMQYPIVFEHASSPVLSTPPSRSQEEYQHIRTSHQADYIGEEVTVLDALEKGMGDGPNTGKTFKDADPAGGITTNSDHSISEFYDAFEADREYSFLCSPAEKEVSSALRQAIGISQPSSGQLLRSREDGAPSFPAFDPAKFASRLRAEKAKEAERNVKQAGSFYNSSAISSAWHMSDTEIKVPTSPFPPHSSNLGTPEPQELWSHIDLKDGVIESPWTAMPATSSVADRAQDWVTVSEEQQDGPGRPLGLSMGRVLTGSSIANYSDHLLVTKSESIPIHDPRAIHPNVMPWWDKLPSAGMASQSFRGGPFSRQNEQRPIAAMSQARPLSNYDNLHFPLVALQDAQRIQGYRRASGLEDQATSGSFVNYHPMVARSERHSALLTPPPRTFVRASSLYSTDPLTQNMYGDETAHSSYYSDPLRQNPVRTSGNPFQRGQDSVMDRLSRRSAYLTGGHLRQPRLTTRSMTRRFQDGTDPELGRLAGRDSDYRHHQPLPLSREAQKRQEFFFLMTVIINLPLPFWGLAVLYGKMDSAVSWCTKGEAYGLAERHRG